MFSTHNRGGNYVGGVVAAPSVSDMAALAALATTKRFRGKCFAKLNGVI